jgi:hypothetical protein
MTPVKTLKSIVPTMLLVLCGCAGETPTTQAPATPAAAASKAADEAAALDALSRINEAQAVSADVQTYTISAPATTSATSPARSFFTDQSGIIRAEQDKPATAQSPVVTK